MSRATIAAFDFDKTLTTRDTVVPFLIGVAGRRRLFGGLLRDSPGVLAATARRDRDALRALATHHAFRDRAIADIDRRAAEYGDELFSSRLRSDTAARLGWHLDQGHQVVIVSASHEQYVRVVGERFGVHGVLATRLEVDGGRCTGRLLGENCRGPEKVRRLHAWLADRGIDRDQVTLWAYGDSAGDRELLADADHPHVVSAPLDSVSPATAR